MGPQDQFGAFLDGIGCTVCDAPVAAERVRLLARRDDLIFLQVDCASCGSTSLGFIADEPARSEADRLSDAPGITADDVLDMHDLLAGWTGDLAGLLVPDRPARSSGDVPHGSVGRRRGRRTGRPA